MTLKTGSVLGMTNRAILRHYRVSAVQISFFPPSVLCSSACLAVCLAVCLSVFTCLSVCLSFCLSAGLCLSVHLSVCMSSVCMSVCLSVCLSVCQLSVSLSVWDFCVSVYHLSVRSKYLINLCHALSDAEIVNGNIGCECPLACEVVTYETTISTAAFPDPSLIKILQTRGYNKTDDYLR